MNAGVQLARKVGLAVRVAKLIQEMVLEVAEKALQEARRAQPERFFETPATFIGREIKADCGSGGGWIIPSH